MGDFKPLMDIRGKSVIGRIIMAFRRAGIDRIIVVGGFRGEELREALSGSVCFVFNDDYDHGMFTSIKKGTEAVKSLDTIDGFFLTPVDTPLLTETVVEQTGRAYGRDSGA